jgi:hypothetical protein
VGGDQRLLIERFGRLSLADFAARAVLAHACAADVTGVIDSHGLAKTFGIELLASADGYGLVVAADVGVVCLLAHARGFKGFGLFLGFGLLCDGLIGLLVE